MKIILLLLLSLACCQTGLSALERGMTTKEVRNELGKPESKLAKGEKEVHIYPNGDKLVFINAGLSTMNGHTVASAETISINTAAVTVPDVAPDARLDTAPGIQENQGAMVTEDAQPGVELQGSTGDEDHYSGNDDHEFYATEDYVDEEYDYIPSQPVWWLLLIQFSIEAIITLVVLKAAFHYTGFPNLWGQIILLSLAVTVCTLVIDYIIPGGQLGYFRNGLVLLTTVFLIRAMTDVREWNTAFKISAAARVITLILAWIIVNVTLMLIEKIM